MIIKRIDVRAATPPDAVRDRAAPRAQRRTRDDRRPATAPRRGPGERVDRRDVFVYVCAREMIIDIEFIKKRIERPRERRRW